MAPRSGFRSRSTTSRGVLVAGLGACVGLTMLLLCSLGWHSSTRRWPQQQQQQQQQQRANDRRALETEPVQFAKLPPRKTSCWVFNHQHRAGGSTIKHMLETWADGREGTSIGLYDSTEWLRGSDFAHSFLEEEHTLTWGAYTEGLRPHGGGDQCKWFTIFRHPIPRLVSAYFFCKKNPVHGLCSSVILKANETDIYTFAEHWGNYGLRQFSLAYALPEKVVASEAGSRHRCVPQKGRKECPGWYRLKLYLEGLNRKAELAAEAEGGLPLLRSSKKTTMKDGAMLELIEPVTELLNDKYAAVGILEQWDASMRLFEHALRLPGYHWKKGSRSVGKKNANGKFKKEENEALATAWTDPRLKISLLLDLVLYDHAVHVFDHQCALHGVVVA